LIQESSTAPVYNHKPKGPYERFIKRPLDAFLATLALVGLSPVIGVTAVLVKMKLGSPVIFKQPRPGKIDPATGEEKIFNLYKFRTMTDAKDAEGNLLPAEERLTKFGRALRATSLDELPELVNILKGDMAVIGPRPLLVRYLPYYTKEERRRHTVRPGLSGLAQANGRNALTWEQKFAYDTQYVDEITFLGDVKIIGETLIKAFKKSDITFTGVQIEDFEIYRSSCKSECGC
jgi:lipopolysaccharide/colanic/teichoic acid biosynthesis glycosyltransferase